jgi:very-long-chain (3R)-3-hydroxyacyl-CoA dehydratase
MADRPQDTKTRSSSKQSSNTKTGYLVLYNFISAILWATVLGRVLAIAGFANYAKVYLGVGEFAKWTQTLAILEVVHAALGASTIIRQLGKKG